MTQIERLRKRFNLEDPTNFHRIATEFIYRVAAGTHHYAPEYYGRKAIMYDVYGMGKHPFNKKEDILVMVPSSYNASMSIGELVSFVLRAPQMITHEASVFRLYWSPQAMDYESEPRRHNYIVEIGNNIDRAMTWGMTDYSGEGGHALGDMLTVLLHWSSMFGKELEGMRIDPELFEAFQEAVYESIREDDVC